MAEEQRQTTRPARPLRPQGGVSGRSARRPGRHREPLGGRASSSGPSGSWPRASGSPSGQLPRAARPVRGRGPGGPAPPRRAPAGPAAWRSRSRSTGLEDRHKLAAARRDRAGRPVAPPRRLPRAGGRGQPARRRDVRVRAAQAPLRQGRGVDVAVEYAANGHEALGRLGAPPRIDLVMADLYMPVMDGFALVERMRADPRSPGSPVIVISAGGPDARAARRRAGGRRLPPEAGAVRGRDRAPSARSCRSRPEPAFEPGPRHQPAAVSWRGERAQA